MKKETGRFRYKKVSFTATSNKVLFDHKLSMDTKTLHSMITYYISIPEFTLYKSHLQRQTGCGITAFNRMWKELKENGYLAQYKFQDVKGTFYYEYELFDESQDIENQPQVQNVYVVEREQTNPDVQNPYMDNPHMDSPLYGECTSINKPLKNKTLFNKNIKNKQQPKEEVVAVNDAHLSQIDTEIISEFKHAFGRKPSPKVQEKIKGYLSRFEKDVVLHAVDIAGSKNKGWDYAQGILKVWWQEQVFSFDQVFEYEEQYQ